MNGKVNKPDFILFENIDDLCNAAEEQANNVDDQLKQPIKLYYIARYFVSIYEARYAQLPIQVWNEYRNALDHYFRWQSTKDTLNDVHRSRMERHLQRAALDILKLFTHETLASLDGWNTKYPIKVYALVDNGSFWENFIESKRLATKLFEKAKVSDINLGDEGAEDDAVLRLYLEAAFETDALNLEMSKREPDVLKAQSTLEKIHSDAHNHSTWDHYKIHTKFYLGWTIAAVILGWCLNTDFAKNVKSKITNYSASIFNLNEEPKVENIKKDK